MQKDIVIILYMAFPNIIFLVSIFINRYYPIKLNYIIVNTYLISVADS